MSSVKDPSLLGALRERRIVLSVVALVGGLSLANWVVSPGQGRRWLGAGLLLPTVWLGMALWCRWVAGGRRRRVADVPEVLRYFQSAATLLVLAVGTTLTCLTAQVGVAERVLRLAGFAVALCTLGAVVWMNLAARRQE